MHERVRRVETELLVLDGDDFRNRGRRQFAGDAGDRLAEHRNLHRQLAAGELLRGRHGLPAGAIELAVLLFRNDENHRTLASSRSRRTSSAAASADEPPIITVCFDFCGA